LPDDDMLVSLVRFESREKAMANSTGQSRPNRAKRMQALFDARRVHDCEDVTLLRDGSSDTAGFIQVIGGKVFVRVERLHASSGCPPPRKEQSRSGLVACMTGSCPLEYLDADVRAFRFAGISRVASGTRR
jgi:hypothetical protein